MFQSDGHNPIDVSAFRSEAPPAPAPAAVRARPRLSFPRVRGPRTRGPQPPVMPGPPPSLPKRAKEPKAAKEPKPRDKEEPRPPIDVLPPGAWPPSTVPGQVSLPASIAYVVWRAAVFAVFAAFYVVKAVFKLALWPFLHMLG